MNAGVLGIIFMLSIIMEIHWCMVSEKLIVRVFACMPACVCARVYVRACVLGMLHSQRFGATVPVSGALVSSHGEKMQLKEDLPTPI